MAADATDTAAVLNAGREGTAHALVLDARRLADAGRLDEAFATAREAIEHDKMDPQAHYMLGTILRARGETTQALAEFERALYLHQDFIAAHFSVATLWHQLGADAKARRHFGIALSLINAAGDMDMLLEPGDISARNMAEIIKTFLERRI
jgi:chemotaxis protein methyltransferase CheR